MMCAGGLLCLILTGNLFSAPMGDILNTTFSIPEDQVIRTWAAEYAQGTDLWQIMVEQCRHILIEAGYEG